MNLIQKKISLTIIFNLFALSMLVGQEIAIQLYSLRNYIPNDVEGSFKTISDWGIRYLEGGDTYGLSHQQYQELLDTFNLKMIGIAADYDDLNNDLEKIIQQAKKFNVTSVACFWIPHEGSFSIEDAEKQFHYLIPLGKNLKNKI